MVRINTIRMGILISLSSLLCSCAGTLFTRAKGDFAGSYPYQAVGADLHVFTGTFGRDLSNKSVVTGIAVMVAMPFDLFTDTVLLPADLIFWVSGYKKQEFAIK